MPAQTVTAKDDATEKTNLGVARQFVDAFNEHDDKALATIVTDDAVVVRSVTTQGYDEEAADRTSRAAVEGFLRSEGRERRLDGGRHLSRDDRVARGTNDGDLAMMHVKKTGKKVSVPFSWCRSLPAERSRRAGCSIRARAWHRSSG